MECFKHPTFNLLLFRKVTSSFREKMEHPACYEVLELNLDYNYLLRIICHQATHMKVLSWLHPLPDISIHNNFYPPL